jgi:hypothetical protein
VHFNAVGQLDVRKPDPVQKDSIFRIYSMTKCPQMSGIPQNYARANRGTSVSIKSLGRRGTIRRCSHSNPTFRVV